MSRTLLLADDSVVIQKLVGLSFANEDIEIITVDNGDDAVSRAVEIKPDLVLADVVMPGLSGYEVCSSVRQNAELADIPVLLLTGTFEAFDEGRAQEVGASGYITKPFEANALVERVNELLAATTAPVAAAPPAANNDLFDDNLGNLGAPVDEAMPSTADTRDATDDFAFGSSELEPLGAEPDLASGDIIFPETRVGASTGGSDMNNLLDGAGGDHTIAMIPEPIEPVAPLTSSMSGDPVPSPPPPVERTAVANSGSDPIFAESPAPSANGVLNNGDLLSAPSATDPGETMLASDVFADPSVPDFGDARESGDPLADPMGPGNAISFDSEFTSPAPITERPSLGAQDLSYGDSDTSPAVSPTPMTANPDETVLAGDLFGETPVAPAGPASSIDPTPPPLPAAEPLQSNGLDLDFSEAPSAASASDSVFPESFDVSASDLSEDPALDTVGAKPGFTTPAEPEGPVAGASLDSFASKQPESEVDASATPVCSPSAPFAREAEDIGGPAEEAAAANLNASLPDISQMMRQRVHDTLEKVAWEAFSDISENVVRQVLERVEQVAWEVIPQMAETVIQEEIRRMKDGKE